MSESQRPAKCPRCQSPDPARHPAVQSGGEVQVCPDHWHSPQPARPEGAMVMVPREPSQRMIDAGSLALGAVAEGGGGPYLYSDATLAVYRAMVGCALFDAACSPAMIAATQQSPISGEGATVLSENDHAVIARCVLNIPKLYRRGQHAGYYQHSDVADLIDIIGRLNAPPVPSVSGGEDQGSSAPWADTHRVSETAVVGDYPEWLDGTREMPVGTPEWCTLATDKIEGLTADLRFAVQVAWRRGAKEWARLNYPGWVEWLKSCDADSVSGEGGR